MRKNLGDIFYTKRVIAHFVPKFVTIAFISNVFIALSYSNPIYIFTWESSYCFQRVLAIAILSICPSVCLSVTRVDQSKTANHRNKLISHSDNRLIS